MTNKMLLPALYLTAVFGSPFFETLGAYRMDQYLLHGKVTAKQGHRDELAAILVEASKLVSDAPGCRLYSVSLDDNDINSVFVTEIWHSKEDHDNSLNVAGVKDLIMKAMPLIDGKPAKGHELRIIGDTGL